MRVHLPATPRQRLCCAALGLLIALSSHVSAAPPQPDAPAAGRSSQVDFARDIQPIFQAKCSSCHGVEAQEGGLRLDLRKAALDGGDGGRVLVPKDSGASRLFLRAAGLGDEDLMPPEGEGTPLTAEEVARIKTWIEQGAVWPEETLANAGAAPQHWAFQPAKCPQIPVTHNREWGRNEIDAFILQKLEAEGVKPSPQADRATLIRRLYLDLIGLPPTVDQRSRWMNEERGDWYERLVDELLRSPHYGERWGRHWLDLARYADSDGYEKDSPRPHAWRWRNWVIQALNDDMPYDHFTIEQLAGDLLPNASLEQKVATGFHRNTLINREGGIDPEEDRVKRTVDRTNTLGSVWLGMTVECAQCHSHKYDPLTQKEYYELYAFFNTLAEPDIGAPLKRQREAYELAKADFDAEHQQYLAAIRQYEEQQLADAIEKWEQSSPDAAPVWTILRPVSVNAKQGTTLKVLEDGSVLASGKHPGREEIYSLVFATDLSDITGIRLEALTDDSLPEGGPGRGPLGNFHITRFDVAAAPADDSAKPVEVALHKAQATFSESGNDVVRAINASPTDGWSIAPRGGEDHVATFETKERVGFTNGTRLTIDIWQSSVLRHFHGLGRFRISITTAKPADKQQLPLHGVTDVVAKALAMPREQRSPMLQNELIDYYRMIDPELKKLQSAADQHNLEAPENPYLTTRAQVVSETREPRKTHFLVRGDFLQPDYEVQPNTPSVFPPLKPRGQHPDRLDLARWLVAPDHPLIARVAVNRVWSVYFGRGIVPSVRDFGTQGTPPSHPELLDWLAVQFRDGWSLKELHKLIVTSATYRQSSSARPELAERDPYNAWLSHQNRLRVDAEVVRDLALSVSGLLKHQIGGPSVRPPQPAGVADLGYAGSVKWEPSQGDDRYRRGLYTFFQRTVPYPMLTAFDMPDSNLACTKRERSNTPLQALTLWNDPVFFECARELGRRIVESIPNSVDQHETLDERIRLAFQLCLSRDPSADDVAAVRELYAAERRLAATTPQAALEIIGRDDGVSADQAADRAAWIIVARALISLDEFITRG
ncbi:MAG: PSD1 domain-containing protein [Planctomycetes bacterium]|nr:PSD1 domain-containing protein [Planctomycetota bacterium]